MKTLFKTLSALMTLLLVTSAAWAAQFEIAKGDKGSMVTFNVSAPLETIVGTSPAIGGYFEFNPENVKASRNGRFEVDVAAFKTGIELRDQHFRDNYLHTQQYPKAVFTLDKILSASRDKVSSGESVDLELEGTLDMHGVKRQEKVKATVAYLKGTKETQSILPGNILAINASFRVRLADYNIERPQMLVLRVGEVVDVNPVIRLTDAPQMAKGGACGGCGGGCGGCGGGCGGCGGSDGGCGGCGG
jgi:polyisoprenoid-binding protein YceI